MEITPGGNLEPLSSSFSSVRAGIDWLSCSVPRGDTQSDLWLKATALIEEAREAGNRVKPWKLKSLQGVICDGTVRAFSPTHVFAQVTSERARAHAANLISSATHVSRIDLQVTAEGRPGANRSVARRAYRAVAPHRRGGRPISRTLLLGTNGAATCYLGSRSSDIFGRVYDKGVESGWAEPGTIWRWELELKRDVANLNARELLQVEDLEEAVAGMVSAQLAQWNVSVPYKATSSPNWPHNGRPDAQRLLMWLASGVQPSVTFLRSLGLLSEVLQALGLDDPTTDSRL